MGRRMGRRMGRVTNTNGTGERGAEYVIRHASSDFLPATPKAFLRFSRDRFRRIFDPSELFFFSPSVTDNLWSEDSMGS